MNSNSKILNTTLIQSQLHWEDADANRRMFSEKIHSISEKTDLIILPEMFTTGFSMNAAELAEETEAETLNWMREIAKSKSSAVRKLTKTEENNQRALQLQQLLASASGAANVAVTKEERE